MPEAGISQFADVLTYLTPGLLVVLALVARFRSDRFSHEWGKLGFGEILLCLLAASLVGLVSLKLSALIIRPLKLVIGTSVLEGIIHDFREYALVEGTLKSRLALQDTHPVSLYRYTQVIVQEHAPRNAEAAERLMSLSLMCRSLVLTVPLSFAVVFKPMMIRFGRNAMLAAIPIVLLLEYLLLKAFLGYWSAAVWRVMRTYVMLQTLG